jgi:hypothetical protein
VKSRVVVGGLVEVGDGVTVGVEDGSEEGVGGRSVGVPGDMEERGELSGDRIEGTGVTVSEAVGSWSCVLVGDGTADAWQALSRIMRKEINGSSRFIGCC